MIKNIKTLEELKALLVNNKALIISSPMRGYNIRERKFRDRNNTLMVISKKNDKLYYNESELIYDIEDYLSSNISREIVPVSGWNDHNTVSAGDVLTNFLYNVKQKSPMVISDSSENVFFIPEVYQELNSQLKSIRDKKEQVNVMIRNGNVVDSYFNRSTGKQKKLSSDLVIVNRSNGSNVIYFMLEGKKYKFGGTHLNLTNMRLEEIESRYSQLCLTWSDLTWSNWMPESGYNRSFDIAKIDKKGRLAIYNLLKEIEEASRNLNSQKRKLLKAFFPVKETKLETVTA